MAAKAGYLTKKNGFRPNWLRRWFAIEGEHLNCYEERTEGLTAGGDSKPPDDAIKQAKDTLRGTVSLALIQAARISTFEAGAEKANPHEFELVTSERTHRLVAESDADRRAWVDALQPPTYTEQSEPVDKEKAKALAEEGGVAWSETYSDQFDDMADEDGVIPADIWNSEIEDMIAARARNEVAAASGAKHVFGWAPENVHVFIAAFNRYEGDADATWVDADRLDKEMHEYFVCTVGVPEAQAVLLMDGDGTVANATGKLSALCAGAKEDDLLFIYWGSHGSVSTVGESGYQKDTYQTKAFDGWISGIDFANIIDKVRKTSPTAHMGACFATVSLCPGLPTTRLPVPPCLPPAPLPPTPP